MARKLDAMPARRNGNPIYPWDQWLDGSVWEVTHGEDFTCGMQSFRNMIHQAATRKGIIVRAHTTGEKTIAIQAVRDDLQQ